MSSIIIVRPSCSYCRIFSYSVTLGGVLIIAFYIVAKKVFCNANARYKYYSD